METIINMFASFVGFCGGVVLITETVNKVFKVEGTTAPTPTSSDPTPGNQGGGSGDNGGGNDGMS